MKKIGFPQLFSLAINTLALKRAGHCWIDETPTKLHARVKEIAEELKENLPPLSDLHFHEAGAFAYSAELSQALDLLQQAGLIRRENPSFDRFRPTRATDSEEVIAELTQTYFGDDEPGLAAFNQLVDQLETLRLDEEVVG